MIKKLNLTFKSVSTYAIINIILGLLFFAGAFLIVDKFNWLSAFYYSIIAYTSIGTLKYVLLAIYWKKRR